jgi:hypothetical protein
VSEGLAASLGAAAPPLLWSHRPWRDEPWRAAVGLVAGIALALLAVRVTPVPLAGWALALALLAMTGPAYLPTACRVDAGGVARRIGLGWERRTWESIRRARLGSAGLYVSTLARGGPLEPFRGLLLPLPRRPDPDLLAALRDALVTHGY